MGTQAQEQASQEKASPRILAPVVVPAGCHSAARCAKEVAVPVVRLRRPAVLAWPPCCVSAALGAGGPPSKSASSTVHAVAP